MNWSRPIPVNFNVRIPAARACLFAIATALGGWAILSFIRTKPERFPLPGGGVLEVLAVAAGTNHLFSAEPRWKQFIRFALPDRWETSLGKLDGHRANTTNEVLWIWLLERNSDGRPKNDFTRKFAHVFFENSYREGGSRIWPAAGHSLLQFDVYPRDQQTLKIELGGDRDSATFTVINPHPVQPENWHARPLPQAVESDGIRVSLEKAARDATASSTFLPVDLRVLPVGSGKPGWFYCQWSTIDSLGNRRHRSWSHFYSPPFLPRTAPALKLNVEVQEYLSAGFVQVATRQAPQELYLDNRARELGVLKMAFVRAGHFRVRMADPIDSLMSASKESNLSWSPSVVRGWELQLEAGTPGILLVADQTVTRAQIRARLRERTSASHGGKAFNHFAAASATNDFGGQRLVATFFTPAALRSRRPALDAQIPGVDSQQSKLEAELVITHAPVEFTVSLSEPATDQTAPTN